MRTLVIALGAAGIATADGVLIVAWDWSTHSNSFWIWVVVIHAFILAFASLAAIMFAVEEL